MAADGSWKLHRRDDDTAYDPRIRPFYLKAADKHRTVWSEPYVFSKPAGEIARALLTSLAGFRGNSRATDDVTFVIVKFIAASGTSS